MVALGALAGLWLFRRELARAGLPEAALDAAVYGLVGGLLGAKLLYVVEHLGEGSFFSLFLDRGGMSWFGGFVGGLLAGYGTIRIKKWPVMAVLAAATPALAVGQLLGRIGCFLVGDDYGSPTSLPWGVAFPRGLPPTLERVHPTQIYEAIPLVGLAILLTRLRAAGTPDRQRVLGVYLAARRPASASRSSSCASTSACCSGSPSRTSPRWPRWLAGAMLLARRG